MKSNEYTTKAYWEDYYRQSAVNQKQIEQICGRYDAFWDQLVASCHHAPQSIIEIGAYPGRYIAYLAARYGLEATALDYNSDRSKIEEAFEVMKVKRYEIIQADFLKYEPTHQYDLVISNGFIEHFENYDEVLDRHYSFLAPGGAILVMIPNKRYLRKWYGWLVDYSNLRAHNLKCMKLGTFKNFAKRSQLDLVYLDYYGGFPYRVHQKLNQVQTIIYATFRNISLLINPWIQKKPNRFLSSSMIAIFRKSTEYMTKNGE